MTIHSNQDYSDLVQDDYLTSSDYIHVNSEPVSIWQDCIARALGASACPIAKYCPEKPTQKQEVFLSLPNKEVLFGGSAGGGKSSALLMAALMYVDKPGYSALILRRDFARLSLPGSSLDRARSWLSKHKDVKFNSQEKIFRFPSGATLQFGYIDSPSDKYRYASSEFHFIGYDELTEFQLTDDAENNPYLFLFSRLRKTKGLQVPLRIRGATNPGNIGHGFVLDRFISDEYLASLDGERSDMYQKEYVDREGNKQVCIFVPSFIEDNPHLSADEYKESLSHLPPITRERLLRGDWSVTEQGLIHAEWFRNYQEQDGLVTVNGKDEELSQEYRSRDLLRFVTIDPAGTSADKAKTARGKDSSWSVIGVWDRTPDGKLLLRHVIRRKWGFTELCHGIRMVYAEYKPSIMLIENEKYGMAAQELLEGELPIKTIATGGKDKVTRATTLLLKMERGEFFLPQGSSTWREAFEKEALAWTGQPNEVCDQIDMCAYAAIHCERTPRTQWGSQAIGKSMEVDLPKSYENGVAIGVFSPVPDEKECRTTSMVALGLDHNGQFWAHCVNSNQSGEDVLSGLDRLRDMMTVRPFAIVFDSHWHRAFERMPSHLDHDVVFRTRSNEMWERMQPIDEAMRSKVLRFAGTPGTTALLGRIRSFPECEDMAPLEALSNAFWAFQARYG